MSEYDNTNTGALFKNNKKADNHPDYKGKINIEGKDWDIAGWIRTSKAGNTYMSMKISEPWKKEEQQVEQQQEDLNDPIPF